MRWKRGVALTVFILTACTAPPPPPPPPVPPPPPPPPPPLPAELQPALVADLQRREWHHVDGPVSEERFRADKARCAAAADGVAEGRRETKYWMAYFDCLRASGYEPVLDREPN